MAARCSGWRRPGTPPALDSDTDGLSNIWETAYGLDPFSSAGDAGATGDPDHDGRTNAQELADGTHPRGTVTRYFAEGATGAFFHTRFDLGNPQQATPAIVRVRFLTDAGVTAALDVIVPPSSHVSIDPATLPGLANATFSTIVEADATVAVDRTMTWDATGYGSHLETGLVAPSTTWYFAEGSTSGDFWLFYLLQNPQATAVTATVRFLRPAGAPIERTYTLPPHSRTNDPRRLRRTRAREHGRLGGDHRDGADRRRTRDVPEPARPAVRRRPRERRCHGAGPRVVPRRGRDRRVLRPVRADRQSGRDRRRRLGGYLLVGGGSLTKTYTRAGEFAHDHLGGRRAAAGGLGAEAARQRRGLDDRAIDQQRYRSSSSARCGGPVRP